MTALKKTVPTPAPEPAAEWGGNAPDPENLRRLLCLSYENLVKVVRFERRRMAHRHPTLDTEGLLHESLLRLLAADRRLSFEDRKHLFATVAKIARRVATDYCRRKWSEKRGGGAEDLEYDDAIGGEERNIHQMLMVQQAMESLASSRPDAVEMVEYRFFLGLSERETAEVLGISLRTVQRRWAEARILLERQLLEPGMPESDHRIEGGKHRC